MRQPNRYPKVARPYFLLGWTTLLMAVIVFVWGWKFHLAHADRVASAATAIGIFVGGGWTLYQFVLRRAFESALSIDYAVRTTPAANGFTVFLEITLANIGNRRITSPTHLAPDEIVDYEDSIKYPADLELKRLSEDVAAPAFAAWWSKAAQKLRHVTDVPEHVSLLYEYTRADGSVDFFMEPGEKYQLGCMFLLPQGHYAAKIVFVGERRSAAEFWSRIIAFRVPLSD